MLIVFVLFFVFVGREEEQMLEERKIFLAAGLEMKKTYLFPSNVIHPSAENVEFDWLQTMNKYYRELTVSPIT